MTQFETLFVEGDHDLPLTGTVGNNLTGATVVLRMQRPDGTLLLRSATITDAATGAWSYTWQPGELVVGTWRVDVEVTYSSAALQTSPTRTSLLFYVRSRLSGSPGTVTPVPQISLDLSDIEGFDAAVAAMANTNASVAAAAASAAAAIAARDSALGIAAIPKLSILSGIAAAAGLTPYKNLATNPGFEATTGTVEVRRNLQANPVFATGIAGTAGLIGATLAHNTTEKHDGYNSTAVATPGVSVNEGVAVTATLAGMSGKTYASGCWVKAAVGVQLRIYTRTVGGANEDSALVTYTANGSWQWVAANLKVAQADATIVQLLVRTGAVVATTFYVTQVLQEERPTVPTSTEWFSGAYSPDTDLTPAWTGTANASASTLSGVGIVGAAAPAFSSSQWAASGGRSARRIPVSTSTDTYISPGGDIGGLRLGMVAGGTYTALGTVRLTAAQTGTVDARARRVVLTYRDSGGTYVETNGTQAPNAAGTFVSRVTVTIPVGATESYVRLYNGASGGNGDVWWDNFALVEGYYDGPWASGDSANGAWDGTANASTTTFYGAAPLTRWAEAAGRTAYAWDSTNHREQLIYGDTGWRDISSLISTDAVLTTVGSWYLRRIGSRVALQATGVTKTAVAKTLTGLIPTGFRAAPANGVGILGDANNSLCRALSNTSGDIILAAAVSSAGSLGFTWTTSDTWPGTLPGTPSGTIPTT